MTGRLERLLEVVTDIINDPVDLRGDQKDQKSRQQSSHCWSEQHGNHPFHEESSAARPAALPVGSSLTFNHDMTRPRLLKLWEGDGQNAVLE